MTTIPISKLVEAMSFGIYHATSLEAYRQILKDGEIRPGNQIEHKNYPQSRLSNCHELGCVACFDFERADRSELFGDDAMMKWPGVLLSYRFSDFPTTVAIGFDRSDLPEAPLYYQEIKRRLGLGGIIPYWIECCYPGPMPLGLCRHIVLVCHWNETPLTFAVETSPHLSDNQIEGIGTTHKALAEQYRLTLNEE